MQELEFQGYEIQNEKKEKKEVQILEKENSVENQNQPLSLNEISPEVLKSLGLTTVAKKIGAAQKMATAYGKYLFISQERINKFNEKLREETIREDPYTRSFKRLVFIPLENYNELPPQNVLSALAEAKATGCFDTFEVAKIDWIKEVKDPILFGVVNGCSDKFFISQWDDDVKIEDLMFMG